VRVSGKWLIVVLLGIGACLGAVYWWWAGGDAFVRDMLTPRFRVLVVDMTEHTMKLRQTDRVYTVRCGVQCGGFAEGQSYSAMDRGSDLELRVGGRRLSFPIIKIEVHFDARPGGVGIYLWS
jgi:hypothetical protein